MDVEVDISDKFGEVNDQGRRLTCLAFAATAAHEYCQRLVQPLRGCLKNRKFKIFVSWHNKFRPRNVLKMGIQT